MDRSLGRYSCTRPSEAIRAVVTLETHREHDGASQQARIRRTVRRVTRLAAVYPYRGVLEDERTALFGVAFEAGLFIRECLRDHPWSRRHSPRRSKRTVRIVAIRTIHESFVDPMLEWQIELRSDIGVTSVAELTLGLCQQPLGRLRFVDGVTGRTGHSIQGVLGPADIRAAERFAVTRKAGVENTPGRKLRERDNRGLASVRVHVGSSGTVTPFTSLVGD